MCDDVGESAGLSWQSGDGQGSVNQKVGALEVDLSLRQEDICCSSEHQRVPASYRPPLAYPPSHMWKKRRSYVPESASLLHRAGSFTAFIIVWQENKKKPKK